VLHSYGECEKWLLRAETALTALDGSGARDAELELRLAMALGALCLKRCNFDLALKSFQTALELVAQASGPDAEDAILVYRELGETERLRKNDAGAAAMFERSRDVAIKVFGPESDTVAQVEGT
jgi:hypothetical protein